MSEYMLHTQDPSSESLINFTDERTRAGERERAARLMHVRKQVGFYPHGKRELSTVMALTSHDYSDKHGSARYLNDILRHQKKYEEAHQNDDETYDPQAALRSIVTEWNGYFKNCRGEITALQLLSDELQGDIEPLAGLGNLPGVRDWRLQDITQRAVGALTREHDMEQFVHGRGVEPLDKQYVTTDKRTIQHEADVLGAIRVRDARRIVPELINTYEARAEFWHAKLSGAQMHHSVRGMVSQLLSR